MWKKYLCKTALLKIFEKKMWRILVYGDWRYTLYKLVHVLLYDILVCTLFWDDIMIIWDENLFTFLTEKKNQFWTNKKFVYLIFINKLSWYHPKITYKNIVQKDMNKFINSFKWVKSRESSGNSKTKAHGDHLGVTRLTLKGGLSFGGRWPFWRRLLH